MAGASLTPNGLVFPTGTTAERPSTPIVGMLRFNTTLSVYEYYNGTQWVSVFLKGEV